MAEHLSPETRGGYETYALPISDRSCVELIKSATGWKEICLQAPESKRFAALQAFWPVPGPNAN